METNEIYAERLEKKGVKPTAVRILVLKAMMEASCAVSLIELETMLATVDRSTIFWCTTSRTAAARSSTRSVPTKIHAA